MAELKLDIIVLQTYNIKTFAVVDASVYPTDPPDIISPSIRIKIPGFNAVEIPFNEDNMNVFNSLSLGIATPVFEEGMLVEEDLPDGIYNLTYSIAPVLENFVDKSFMRVNKIQEKFDNAFMSLDMMECDRVIKAQAKTELDTIHYLIQGSVASANNCAVEISQKLYNKASVMLDRFISGECGCS